MFFSFSILRILLFAQSPEMCPADLMKCTSLPCFPLSYTTKTVVQMRCSCAAELAACSAQLNMPKPSHSLFFIIPYSSTKVTSFRDYCFILFVFIPVFLFSFLVFSTTEDLAESDCNCLALQHVSLAI